MKRRFSSAILAYAFMCSVRRERLRGDSTKRCVGSV